MYVNNNEISNLIVTSEEIISNYKKSTDAYKSNIVGIFKPKSIAEVQAILQYANQRNLKIWPVSSGRNFGYGTAQGGCNCSYYILDLSLLKDITYEGNGVVTIGAGVTQKDLYNFLRDKNLDYLVPITGAGPDCSLIGNAIDGGYGQTPITDHFDAFLKFSGFWGSGEDLCAGYFTTVKGLNDESIPLEWSVGVGLNIKSVLRQTGLGVITSGVLKLSRLKHGSQIIIIKWPSQSAFINGQPIIKEFIENFPTSTALSMNSLRSLASMPGISLFDSSNVAERQKNIAQLEQDYYISPWTTILPVFGDNIATTAAVKLIKKTFKSKFKGDLKKESPTVINLSLKKISVLHKWINFFLPYAPGFLKKILYPQSNSLKNLSSILTGTPNADFLQLAYTFSKDTSSGVKNPAKENQLGLYWFSPVLPLNREFMMQYVVDVKKILLDHNFDPLLAFTAKSPDICTSITPLLFNKEDDSDVQRVKSCLEDLFKYVKSKNILLYRLTPELYNSYNFEDYAKEAQHDLLKSVFDPKGVLVSKYVNKK